MRNIFGRKKNKNAPHNSKKLVEFTTFVKGPDMITEAQNIFLFVFATMMLAVIVELWSIGKTLARIATAMENQNSLKGEQGAKLNS